ncbi:putative MFS family arabinose efflux permease [Streptomyces sp. 2333.5]|uniref:MFS transporter n=1 Tax=unclassified Streptomyces TaxID=2593676 RepID=UPI000898A369|nr:MULTISPECIES: MFS transporter [unclassified Streptomyces]PJJ01831.1 putative MFS family arabinose efflux permease [Streptomyces sp. 2333.5]SEC82538.1 Predicted arabinose efflux permease, MFS family [Streptomyces sp. 2314.4]SED68053.1 Predicted arabinose efflux permease, MFS family [Streptomyces sp. 2112.2]
MSTTPAQTTATEAPSATPGAPAAALAATTPEAASPPAAAAPAAPATPRPAPQQHCTPPVLTPLGLLTVLLGAALPMIDFFIVNVALPTIDHDLQAGPAMLEMVVAGYGVAYAMLLVLGGRLGDMVGRRRLFLWGLAAFGVTSLACGLAPDAWTLVAARVAQGAASALLLPQVLATIQATTTGKRRARAVSLYGGTAGVSSAVGQVLGGLLVSVDLAGTGWRAVFLVNVPIAAAAWLLAARTVPETRSPHPSRVDGPGTALLAVTLLTLLLPLTEGRAAGWPLWSWILLAVFPVAATAFVLVERRAERLGRTPLVPPSLLRIPSVSSGLTMIVPFTLGFGGFMFVIAVALQNGLHYGPFAAGLSLAPLCLAFFLASLAGPRLVLRFGRRVVLAGSLIQGAGLITLALTLQAGWPEISVAGLAPSMTILGFGQGLLLPVLLRIVLSELPMAQAGVGGGVMVTTQQSGMALGVATLGTLFLSLLPSVGIRDALLIALLTQLAIVAGTTLLALRLPRTVR